MRAEELRADLEAAQRRNRELERRLRGAEAMAELHLEWWKNACAQLRQLREGRQLRGPALEGELILCEEEGGHASPSVQVAGQELGDWLLRCLCQRLPKDSKSRGQDSVIGYESLGRVRITLDAL